MVCSGCKSPPAPAGKLPLPPARRCRSEPVDTTNTRRRGTTLSSANPSAATKPKAADATR